MQINSNLKNFKSFCGKKDAFDCAGIRVGNRKTRARILAQLNASLFQQKDFKLFKLYNNYY